jgi:hypothetical protein
MTWERVTNGRAALGTEIEDTGMFNVSVPMTPVPDNEWWQFFLGAEDIQTPINWTWRPNGGTGVVEFGASKDDLDERINNLRARMSYANDKYAEVVIPRKIALEKREAQKQRDAQERRAAMQAKIQGT